MNDNLFTESNIFGGDVSAEQLFGNDEELETSNQDSEQPENETKENNIPEGPVDAADLFGNDEEEPESVGDNKEEFEEEAKPKETGSSPKGSNLYTSFAQALQGDGLFQFLDEETVSKVKDAESFSEAFENEINARLDDVQRRVNDALNAGVEPNVISQYEKTISNLEGITDESIEAETPQGENLRKVIIKQDFLNRGFSAARAEKQVERIVASGTDIEDAKDALESVKDFFKTKYDEEIQKNKEAAKAEKERIEQEAKDFKKSMLEQNTLFGDIPIDRVTRQKAFDAMTKVVKTTNEGEQLTAVQLYADEHPVEFRSVLGLMYAMTDGFKNMGNILNKSVNKKVKTNLQNIEKAVFGNQHQGGSFRFAEGDDEEETYSKGRKRLDI